MSFDRLYGIIIDVVLVVFLVGLAVEIYKTRR